MEMDIQTSKNLQHLRLDFHNDVLSEMFESGGDPSIIVEEKNLAQDNDEDAMVKTIQQIIASNSDSVADFKDGKENALKFLMGQVMKETRGKANPQMAMQILRDHLEKE